MQMLAEKRSVEVVSWAFLVVQWLGICLPIAGDTGWIQYIINIPLKIRELLSTVYDGTGSVGIQR